MKTLYFWLLTPLLLSSCGRSSLTVQTDYLSHKNLASYFVSTPDPRQNVTAIGQRLIICWSVPKYYLSYENLHLQVTIRFRNREELIEIFHLPKTRGTYVYALLNEDYIAKRGILTYKVDLIGGDCILEEWRHQIWTDLISFNSQDTLTQETNEEEPEEEYPINWNDD